MKLRFSLLIGVLLPLSMFGQIELQEIDKLILDTTINKRFTYEKPSDSDEFELKTIDEFDREKRKVRTKYHRRIKTTKSWSLSEYNEQWKPIKRIGYVYDSIKHTVLNLQYDPRGNCIKTEYFVYSEEDTFKTLKHHFIKNFNYAPNGELRTDEINNFPTISRFTVHKRKVQVFYNRDGQVKKKKIYVKHTDSEKYYLTMKESIRYLKSKKPQVRVQYNLESKSVTVTTYSYEKGLLKKKDTYSNREHQTTREYDYRNGKIIEERFEKFGTENKGYKYTKKYEYE